MFGWNNTNPRPKGSPKNFGLMDSQYDEIEMSSDRDYDFVSANSITDSDKLTAQYHYEGLDDYREYSCESFMSTFVLGANDNNSDSQDYKDIYTKRGSDYRRADYSYAGLSDSDFIDYNGKQASSALSRSLMIGETEAVAVLANASSSNSDEIFSTNGYYFNNPNETLIGYLIPEHTCDYKLVYIDSRLTNGEYLSVNDSIEISAVDNVSSRGELYSVASVNDEIDYTTISWFYYDGTGWTKLNTDLSPEENMNIGARCDYVGPGTYSLMAIDASKRQLSAVENLSYSRASDRDGLIILTFDDPNENTVYYDIYHSDSVFTTVSDPGVTIDRVYAGEDSYNLNLGSRNQSAYVAVVAISGNGARSVVSDIISVNTGEADRDGDGIPDWYCDEYLLWPESEEEKDIANSDDDMDGLTNLEEYKLGSNPKDSYDPYAKVETVAVSGVGLNTTNSKINVGESITLTATVTPSNATNTNVQWYVDDNSIVRIEESNLSCTITGVKEGETKVTVVTEDGGYAATALVNVEKEKTGSFTISFDANGGVLTGISTAQTGTDGKLTTLPSTPTHSGNYSFNGWYTALSGGTQITTNYVFTGDTTVYAQWTYTGGGGSSGGSSATRYQVSIKSATGGKVTASPKSATKGTTVTLTVSVNEGYELKSLTAKDSSESDISLTKAGTNKYTFTMPASKVTITPTLTKIGSEAGSEPTPIVNPFTDVSPDAYYYDAVLWAVERGITLGTSTTTFSPDMSCTRAQMVTFLWRSAGSPSPANGDNPFIDVSAGAYYYDAVLWAAEHGITIGTTDTTFSPDNTVIRGQTVTFMYRNAGSPKVYTVSPFVDVPSDAYYADAVVWAASNDITKGTTDTTFSPNESCTRAQIVTFLYRKEK